MCYKGVIEGKIEKEGKMSLSIFIFIYTIHLAYLSSKTLAPIGAEKSVKEIFIGEKENEQIRGLICYMWLFICYTIQLITIKLCTKFQNPKSSSC